MRQDTITFRSTVVRVLSRVLWTKSNEYYQGGIQTHDLCHSSANVLLLDDRDCPIARGCYDTHWCVHVHGVWVNKMIFFIPTMPNANLPSTKNTQTFTNWCILLHMEAQRCRKCLSIFLFCLVICKTRRLLQASYLLAHWGFIHEGLNTVYNLKANILPFFVTVKP